MKKIILCLAFLFSLQQIASAHCQVPCGVYTDEMRFTMIEEDLQTIEKAMGQIVELSSGDAEAKAKAIRWVATKEEHATKIQETVSVYFMTQRIKPTAENYVEKITTLHAMLISAMKCKQTLDVAHVKTSRELAAKFAGLYLHKHAE